MDAQVFSRQVGLKVRARRKACGLTQRELAEKGHVSERLVRQIEMGTAEGVGLDRLIAVLSVLGLGVAITDKAEPSLSCSSRGHAVDQGERYYALLQQQMHSWSRNEDCDDE